MWSAGGPACLYIGSLGTRQAPGTITFPASGQSVSSRQGVLPTLLLGLCQPDIDICTQIRTQWPRSPHPPLVCEEMLHLFMRIRVNMVFLIRYIGAIKAPHIDKGERVWQSNQSWSVGHNSCCYRYRYRKCLALLIKVLMDEFYNSDNCSESFWIVIFL